MSRYLTVEDKVIFLDIDGVLNSPRYMIQSKERSKAIDPVQVHILNELVKETGALVVLSSTWRISYSPEEMTKMLQAKGAEFELFDETPRTKSGSAIRGVEIYDWINRQTPPGLNFNEFVILDDDSDFLLWQTQNFIHCKPDVGLTPNTAYKAWRTLNGLRNWQENYEDSRTDFGADQYLNQWKLKR